ncbi:MAG: hypothetical protein K6T57_00845 [Thermaceae bacterium]|nr:hypothetical protein [Thermaceae bacterium]
MRLLTPLILLAFALVPVFAHEHAEVGPYSLAIGQRLEPAMTNMVNGLDLIITNKADNSPVEGAEKGLTVEIIAPNGTKRTFSADGKYGPNSLWAQYGQKGRYTTAWILTVPGQYQVHIFGQIGETKVDVTVGGRTWLIPNSADYTLK